MSLGLIRPFPCSPRCKGSRPDGQPSQESKPISTPFSVPTTIKTSGVFGLEAIPFIKELGRRIRAETRDPRSIQFLMQGIAVDTQRGKAAAVRGTSPPSDNVFI